MDRLIDALILFLKVFWLGYFLLISCLIALVSAIVAVWWFFGAIRKPKETPEEKGEREANQSI